MRPSAPCPAVEEVEDGGHQLVPVLGLDALLLQHAGKVFLLGKEEPGSQVGIVLAVDEVDQSILKHLVWLSKSLDGCGLGQVKLG